MTAKDNDIAKLYARVRVDGSAFKNLTVDMNENHDPKTGEFAEGGGGGAGGGGTSGGSGQITSDEHLEYTDTISSIDGKTSGLGDKADELSTHATDLQNAIDNLNNHDVNDEDGSSQEHAADLVREAHDELQKFSEAADAMAKSAANAFKETKDTLKKYEKLMKEHGI